MAPIPLLVLNPLDADRLARIAEGGFTPHVALGPEARAQAIASMPDLRCVLTNGATGFTAAEMDRLPKLGIICAIAVGTENIDVAAARARGIVVTHGPGTNAPSVADHAMALTLALLRDIPRLDAAVKSGEWMGVRWPRPMVSGRRLGILGLGEIGAMIAARAQGGFGMEIAYHNRRPREGVPHRWLPSVQALAEWAEVLLIAAPGGAATRHLVDAAALDALGPQGYLVNIGRGSVVDQEALITALRANRIAGAAIDVVDGEPEVPDAMRALPNLIITPHIAGRSPESILATASMVVANLQAHFAGKPVLTPVA
ncbi:2-hydroxyacid dehydrogenase [Roseococcus sp. SDR]|uniref:2-hydroxyacid dehydrogenase n=1 Tax=Roseococcus sp. SDR TaxID=2835532 RepID=UPI001BCD5A70|nr:2-hydroxyacid dehydrogenase [Roseococcus sp. SDR]MBS7791152.1 2-hydroxyacid dehydrogenase [Roseococcus sp. SDR]MBV1846466.1 2-hydroxyacid dehydrogenase [Roseococcus sp. SDR]